MPEPIRANVLNDEFVEALRQIVGKYRAGELDNQSSFRGHEGDHHFPPGTYVALAPAGGIPARVGTTAGQAECEIHQVMDDGAIEGSAAATEVVFNLSTSAIDVGEYVRAVRDNFGQWLVEAGSGSGETAVVDVVTDVCFSTQQVKKRRILVPLDQLGQVYCTTEPDPCCEGFATGTGTVPDSEVDCTCGGLAPPATLYVTICDLQCGGTVSDPLPSCIGGTQFEIHYVPVMQVWTGSGVDSCGRTATLTMYCVNHLIYQGTATLEYCGATWSLGNSDLNTFYPDCSWPVTQSCSPFDFGWVAYSLGNNVTDYGVDCGADEQIYLGVYVREAGYFDCNEPVLPTGTSTSGGGISNGCCSDLPTTLYLILNTGAGVGCPCVAGGTYTTLTYDAVNDWWRGTEACGPKTLTFTLNCTGTTWGLVILCDGLVEFIQAGITETSCDPFLLSFSGAPAATNCCTGAFTISGTVLETHP